MPLVMIRIPGSDLPSYMAVMRPWLDARRCEPTKFTQSRYGDTVAVCVDFIKDSDAEAFRRRFAGPAQSDTWILDESELRFGSTGNGPVKAEELETIAHACWYRLVAEEVRTEADDFGSDSAKETMAIVARTWDQLAEDLERRLAAPVHSWLIASPSALPPRRIDPPGYGIQTRD